MICTLIRSTRNKYKLHFKIHCKLQLHLQTSVEIDIIIQRSAGKRGKRSAGKRRKRSAGKRSAGKDRKYRIKALTCIPNEMYGLIEECECQKRWRKMTRIGSGAYGSAYHACTVSNSKD